MYKLPTLRTQITGISLACATIALVACSDSNDNSLLADNETVVDGGSQTAGDDSGNADDTQTDAENSTPTDGQDTGDDGSDDSGGDGSDDSGDNTPIAEENTTPDTDDGTVPAIATGADTTTLLDDSPTETESASLVGPFIKDVSRSAGPPSAPEDLTLLLAAENWLEFTWKPSSDDQSVEAYEIYRDGELMYTLRGDTGYSYDYSSWITTSYTDCNYTRYGFCDDNPINPGSSYEYRVIAVDNEGMKSALSEPAVFQLAVGESGPANTSNYVQVFSEEFNGNGLDRAKWKTSLPWGTDDIINGELQYYVNTFGSNPLPVDPFVFTGSTLQITGTNTPANLLEQANNQRYLSGVITTADNFKMTYGYVEMSAKVTGGNGFLSTFYLFNQDYQKNKPEIDIIEFISDRPDKAYQTYHYFDSNRAQSSSGERHSSPTMETQTAFDLTAGFHNYSVLWEPELMVWYIDGIEVRRITGVRVSDEPMNIIAQLVIGSEWIGEPDADFTTTNFEIDYIRAWQQQ